MNPIYEDDIENELQRNIHDIKKQNINIQIKLNLCCNLGLELATKTKAYKGVGQE